MVANHVACNPKQMEHRLEEVKTTHTVEFSPEYPTIQLINQDLLKKYILYAKLNCHPILDNVDEDKIAKM